MGTVDSELWSLKHTSMCRCLLLLLLTLLFSVACEPDAAYRRPLDPGVERRLEQLRRQAQSGAAEDLVQLGYTALEAKRYFEAADSLAKARDQGSKNVAVFSGLARTYVALGYSQSAVQAIRACFNINRNEPDCLYAYGMLLSGDPSDGAQKELQRTWERFLKAAPKSHSQRGYVESSLSQLNGRFGKLTQEEIDGVKPKPNQNSQPASAPPSTTSTSTRSTGSKWAGTKPPTGEVDSNHGSTTTSTQSPHANSDVGQLNPFGSILQKAYRAWSDKDLTAAAAHFQAALGMRPDDAPMMAELARVLSEANKFDEAEKWVEKAKAGAPNNPQVRFAFGYVLLNARKRPEEALEAWKSLQKDHPDYAKRVGVTDILAAMKNRPNPNGPFVPSDTASSQSSAPK